MPQQEFRRRTGRRRRRRNRTAGAAVLLFTVFLLIAGIIFFRVREIRVEGAVLYTQEEVTEACGVSIGQNLLFLRASAVSDNLFRALPYAESIRITRRLPGTLTISITERVPVACIFSDGAWWLLDASCKVLEKTNAAGAAECIHLEGLSVLTPVEGERLKTSADDTMTAELLGDVLEALFQQGIAGEITQLEAESLSDVRFVYDGRIRVKMGTCLDAQQKIGLLCGILRELGAEASGELDISRVDEGRFVPD